MRAIFHAFAMMAGPTSCRSFCFFFFCFHSFDCFWLERKSLCHGKWIAIAAGNIDLAHMNLISFEKSLFDMITFDWFAIYREFSAFAYFVPLERPLIYQFEIYMRNAGFAITLWDELLRSTLSTNYISRKL